MATIHYMILAVYIPEELCLASENISHNSWLVGDIVRSTFTQRNEQVVMRAIVGHPPSQAVWVRPSAKEASRAMVNRLRAWSVPT
jgi:hypothetical protein